MVCLVRHDFLIPLTSLIFKFTIKFVRFTLNSTNLMVDLKLSYMKMYKKCVGNICASFFVW
jgi:hypothetical protein